MNLDDSFKIQLFYRDKVEMYVSLCQESEWCQENIWHYIKRLDRAAIRVVGNAQYSAIHENHRSVPVNIINRCSGCLFLLPYMAEHPTTTDPRLLEEIELAIEMNVPVGIVKQPGVSFEEDKPHQTKLYVLDSDDNKHQNLFVNAVLKNLVAIRPYAFFIGRLESDFKQAREAIRTAVENEAGLPFLWIDDGRHRTNVEGIRERTRLLIKHAVFLVADLTLGLENLEHENPSRAHEIGLAMAYDKPVFLCSQEPRRAPYYNIADMQMFFWENEKNLELLLRDWISMYKGDLGRVVYNYQLQTLDNAHQPKLNPQIFNYDPNHRYVGPNMHIMETSSSSRQRKL